MMCAGHESAAQAQSSAGNPLPANRSRQLQARADAGDPVAQPSLGKIYDDGDVARGVVGHKTRSQRSLGIEKAEKQRHPNAMFNLGTAYY
jgi:TPR repeat protein